MFERYVSDLQFLGRPAVSMCGIERYVTNASSPITVYPVHYTIHLTANEGALREGNTDGEGRSEAFGGHADMPADVVNNALTYR